MATTFEVRMGLDILEMVMALEKEFQVRLPDEELRSIRTVGECMSASSGNFRRTRYRCRVTRTRARCGSATSM